MGSLMKRDQKVERNKRYLFLGTSAAGAAMCTVAPVLGGAVILFGGYLGYDWFKFRAKRGMRF